MANDNSLRTPCKHKDYGCREGLLDIDSLDGLSLTRFWHENNCKFKPFCCPDINCNLKLKTLEEVFIHEFDSHLNQFGKMSGPTINGTLTLRAVQKDWVKIQKILYKRKIFYYYIYMKNGIMHHFIRIMGDQNEADNYLFRLQILEEGNRYEFLNEVSSLKSTPEAIIQYFQSIRIEDEFIKRWTYERKVIHFQIEIVKHS